MSVNATIATETDYSDLRRVIDSLTEHEIGIEQTATPSLTGTDVFRVQTTESETLLEFYQLCTEHDIQLDVRQIGHDSGSVTDSDGVASGRS